MGKPLKFKNPEDLRRVVDDYFKNTKMGEWTVTGIALVVGSKQLIQDYEKREGYSEIVKNAKLKVENAYEINLRQHGRTGDIFALKNFGWTDKTEQIIKNKGEQAHKLSPETLECIDAIVKRTKT